MLRSAVVGYPVSVQTLRPAGVVDQLRRARLIRPPGLPAEGERGASRLELFFDLAFVLVVAELSAGLREDISGRGLLVFAGLFAVVWWSWMSAALYANRFDTDDVLYRLAKLAGMLAVVGMAASVADAVGEGSFRFAACYVALRLVLIGQYARAYRNVPKARGGTRLYLAGAAAGASLWAVSLLMPTPARYWLWAAGVLVEVVVPLLTTAASTDVPLHLEHLPERFSLFIILVLGESVAAVAHGLYEAHWVADAVVTAVVSFVVAAALWWSYFDLAGQGAKRLLADTDARRSSLTHDAYVYGQLPLAMALAVTAVGIQHAVEESTRAEPATGTRLLLAGGVAVYLAAISLTNSAMARRWRSGWWAPLVAGVVVVADALVVLPSVVVVGALAVLLIVVVLGGLVQEARGRIELEPV